MAIEKMKHITICAFAKYRKKLLETMQRQGVVEIIQSDIGSNVKKLDTSKSRAVFEKSVELSQKALDVLGGYIEALPPTPSSLSGKKNISADDYYNFVGSADEIMRTVSRILLLNRSISEEIAEKVKISSQLELLKPWENLDVSMHLSETRSAHVFIGSVPYEITLQGLLEKISEINPDIPEVHAEVISSSKELTCLFIVCKKPFAEKLEGSLREIGFTPPPLKSRENPKNRKSELLLKQSELEEEIKVQEREIKSFVGMTNAIRFMIDYYNMRKDKYEVLEKLSLTKKTFVMEGYVPSRIANELSDFLENKFSAIVEIQDVSNTDDVPVLLKNNFFTSPGESVLEGYSLPGKKEIDPTPIMSIFYYILYGIMLSDAAYGFLMSSVCGVALLKFKHMEESLKNMMKLLFYCGLSTMFWGVIFGGYFGDAINLIARNFCGAKADIVGPVWIAPDKNPMTMLAFSFGIGIIHLFAGLVIDFYQKVRDKRFIDAICDSFFWMLVLIGGAVYLMTVPMVKSILTLENLIIPDIVSMLAGYLAIAGLVGILLTSGRESKGFFKKFLKGLYGLYGITGYVSDLLSYSRLLALGLATGVIGSVFNQIALIVCNQICHGGILGIIVFGLIFVIGHSINIGMNALGAYVHSNRLQFVEFFGKFYEGGGRKFSPFSAKTKFYNVKEEFNHV